MVGNIVVGYQLLAVQPGSQELSLSHFPPMTKHLYGSPSFKVLDQKSHHQANKLSINTDSGIHHKTVRALYSWNCPLTYRYLVLLFHHSLKSKNINTAIMSGTSTPGSAPKVMSSRLLTMKFMQRAAASPASSSPTTPDEPPNKRRKKDTDATPSKFNVDALADQRAIHKALADEVAKRQAALERQAAEAGDTRWVLSFEDQKQVAASSALALRVVQTGYANLDSLPPLQVRSMEEPEDKPIVVGRRSYGKFNKILEVGYTHITYV
jgi:M-phase phosphoprotein 6